MKTNSYSGSENRKNFEKFFDNMVIKRLGRTSGFIKRPPQKITATGFVLGFISACTKACYSYSQ